LTLHSGEAGVRPGVSPCRAVPEIETDNAIEGFEMSKRHSAKYKLDRRLGENIWGRPKSPVNRREYGPG